MKHLYRLTLLFLLFSSCVEQIDFRVDRKGGQLVVDGGITNDGGPQRIKLSETAKSARIPVPISDAQVKIIDDRGQTGFLVPDAEHPGTYVLWGNAVRGEVGRTYYIEIVLQDGRTYRSVPETMPAPPAELDAIYYDFSIEKEVNESGIISEDTYINIFVDVNLQTAAKSPFFLRWDVEEVFLVTPTDFPDPFGSIPPPCYVYQYTSATDLNLYDGSKNSSLFLKGVQVASQKIDFGFREKHYFSVYQKSLSLDAFEYWRKVDQLLSNVGNVFDTPPAPIPGNIYNINDREEEVLGYFEVTSTSAIRLHTYQSDIPVDQILECQYSQPKGYSSYPDYCLNCLKIRNSTLKRPAFF